MVVVAVAVVVVLVVGVVIAAVVVAVAVVVVMVPLGEEEAQQTEDPAAGLGRLRRFDRQRRGPARGED